MDNSTKDIESCEQIEDPRDKVPCPFWLEIIPYFLILGLLTFISWKFIDTKPMKWTFPTFSYIFACCCIVQWIYILYERWYYFGSAGFYEIYWYCNLAMLTTAIGIFCNLPSLMGQSMVLTIFPHLSYWIDIMLYPCCRRSVIGTTGWMFEKDTPFHECVSSFHHFWYFPCIFIVLYKQPFIPFGSYYMSIIQFVIFNLISHYMTPMSMIDKTGKRRLLNVCAAYVLPDFITDNIKWTANRSYWMNFFIETVLYNVPFNLMGYALILIIQKLINLI